MPLDFDHKHYVPILKTKAGERWALSHLDAASLQNISPLLELHPHKTNPVGSHVEGICESLEAAWGTENPVFLDTIWLHGDVGNPAVIESTFASAREHLLAIPVVRTSYEDASREEIRSTIEQDGRGYLLRLRPRDLAHAHEIEALLADLNTGPGEGHLLLDYRDQQMNLEFDVPRIPRLAEWRTFTVASGTFPRSLSNFALNQWHPIARTDWTNWDAAIKSNSLLRKPAFSDYTTRDPGAPAGGGLPSVNLRYARENRWLVRIGGRVADGASPQMKQICQSLIAMTEEYDGPDYSAGDAAIFNTAQTGTGPGNAGQWVMWGINHHLVVTAAGVHGHV